MCSATLHSFDVKKLSEKIMHFPTWVDLKGEDSVPETVHHVVVIVNPKTDKLWERLGKNHIRVSSLQVELRLLVQYLLYHSELRPSVIGSLPAIESLVYMKRLVPFSQQHDIGNIITLYLKSSVLT